jgi:hypothetical protein
MHFQFFPVQSHGPVRLNCLVLRTQEHHMNKTNHEPHREIFSMPVFFHPAFLLNISFRNVSNPFFFITDRVARFHSYKKLQVILHCVCFQCVGVLAGASSKAVFLNRRAAARYRALASIITGR